MRRIILGEADSQVLLELRQDVIASSRPLIVIIHGAFRDIAALSNWRLRLEGVGDIVFVGLPGHGGAPPIKNLSVDGCAAAFVTALDQLGADRRVVLVGESLGGTIALAMGGMERAWLKGVVAFEPPLTTAKLWTMRADFERALSLQNAPALARIYGAFFGMSRHGAEERNYYPLIERLRVKADIVMGDEPLFPIRQVSRPPSVNDEVDRYVVSRSPMCRLRRLEGAGHAILEQRPDECAAVIEALVTSANNPH